jgi:hypothetical protein
MAYVPRDELLIKLGMCRHLHLRPLSILRYAPKSYMYLVSQAGGFALLYKWQMLPYGFGAIAKDLRETLGLPVDCPRAIQEGTIKRLLKWHLRHLKPPA